MTRVASEAGALPAPGDAAAPVLPGVFTVSTIANGEAVILVLRPSLWRPIKFLIAPLLILGATLLVLRFGVKPSQWAHAGRLGVAFVAGGAVVWTFVVWLSHRYVLTDKRAVAVRGILRPVLRECTLVSVRSLALLPGPLDKPMKRATLALLGQDGRPLVQWWTLAKPQFIADKVTEAIRRYARPDFGGLGAKTE